MKKKSLYIISTSLILVYVVYFCIKANQHMEVKINNNNKTLHELLLDAQGNPQETLNNLLNICNIKHNGTLSNIVSLTQKEWLRKPGQERWQMDEININDKKNLFEQLDKLACVNEIKPQSKEYDYALMMGALACRIKLRLSYLMNLWKNGTKFKNLVFLVGQRPADPILENSDSYVLNENDGFTIKRNYNVKVQPKNETEIARTIFEQIELPEDFKNSVNVIFIDTPMQKSKAGTLCRPNTGDTINQWIKLHNPQTGSCLVISNNPYIGYQDSVARTLLPKGFNIETVGSASSENEKISIYLDTIARWLYQEQQRLSELRA